MPDLPAVLEAISLARRRYPETELILVDHGSTDGSTEFLRQTAPAEALLEEVRGGTVARVRNRGAEVAQGTYLSFLDSDCLIDPDYFSSAVSVLEETGAVATGSRVALPEDPHWIERVWARSNAPAGDGFTHFINSGNFFVRAQAFHSVGGFNEKLESGEDADLCKRLIEDGGRLYEAKRVRAVHLGNAKSISSFFRKEVWRGLGQFATVRQGQIDKPVAMTLVHLVLTVASVTWVLTGSLEVRAAIPVILGSQLAVPVLTATYRVASNRWYRGFLPSVALYWLFYWARIVAAFRIARMAVDKREA